MEDIILVSSIINLKVYDENRKINLYKKDRLMIGLSFFAFMKLKCIKIL